jgi:hypothetical protein
MKYRGYCIGPHIDGEFHESDAPYLKYSLLGETSWSEWCDTYGIDIDSDDSEFIEKFIFVEMPIMGNINGMFIHEDLYKKMDAANAENALSLLFERYSKTIATLRMVVSNAESEPADEDIS